MLNWSVSARLLSGNTACELRKFLKDHRIKFEERRACGMVELTIACTEGDALRVADALQLVGMRALFDGDDAVLLMVRPRGDSL